MNELRKHLNEVRLMSVSVAKKSSSSAEKSIALHSASEPLNRRVQFSHYRRVSSCDLSSSPSRARESNFDGVIQVTVHREADNASSIAEIPDQAVCSSKERLPSSNKISSTSEPGSEDGLELAQLDTYSGKTDENIAT